jgi:hypothetical protein
MTTLAQGQLVQQNDGTRIWRLDHPCTDRAEPRWWLTLIETHAGSRRVGDQVTASEDWLQSHCRDWAPPVVEPPCGDGMQVMRLVADGDVVAQETFVTAAGMLEWTTAQFETLVDDEYGCDQLVGQWFGWCATPDEAPDMTVRMNEDAELVWAEA